MNRGVLSGLKSLFIPSWAGGGDPANDGALLGYDSTQPGGVKPVPAGTFVKNPTNAVSLLGTSISALESAPTSYSSNRSYWAWANAYAGGRFSLVSVSAASGYTSSQILATLLPTVLSDASNIVIIEPLRNDINSAVASATTIANIKSIVTQVLNAGKRPVLCTATPQNTFTTAQYVLQYKLNDWCRRYALTQPGLILCDWAATCMDYTTGNWKANYSPDGTHPSSTGANAMGLALSQALSPVTPAVTRFPYGGTNTVGVDLANLVTNPAFTNPAAGVAGGWTATGTGYTPTTVACTDIGGFWQQFVMAATGSVTFSQPQTIPNAVKGVGSPGDVLYAGIELQGGTDWATTITGINLKLSLSGGGNVQSMFAADSSPQLSPNPNIIALITPPITVASDTTATLSVAITGTGGTVSVRRPFIYSAALA